MSNKSIDRLINLLTEIPTQPQSWNAKTKSDIKYMVEDAIKLALVVRDEIKDLEKNINKSFEK